MTRQNALSVTLAVSNGGDPEVFTVLGGLTVSRLVLGRRVVTSGYLGDGGWRRLLAGAGVRGLSLTGSGEFTDSAAEESLCALSFSGAQANWRVDFVAGGVITAPCIVSAYERISTVGDILKYQLSLESAGEVNYTA